MSKGTNTKAYLLYPIYMQFSYWIDLYKSFSGVINKFDVAPTVSQIFGENHTKLLMFVLTPIVLELHSLDSLWNVLPQKDLSYEFLFKVLSGVKVNRFEVAPTVSQVCGNKCENCPIVLLLAGL